MMNTGDTLDFPIKLHAGRVRSGCGFQVFSGAQFGEHLALDAPLFTSGRHPARLKGGAVWIALQPDILLLRPAQLLRQLSHHTVAGCRFQIRQQGRQPVIHPLQVIHVSPSTFRRVRRVPAPLQRSIRCRLC